MSSPPCHADHAGANSLAFFIHLHKFGVKTHSRACHICQLIKERLSKTTRNEGVHEKMAYTSRIVDYIQLAVLVPKSANGLLLLMQCLRPRRLNWLQCVRRTLLYYVWSIT